MRLPLFIFLLTLLILTSCGNSDPTATASTQSADFAWLFYKGDILTMEEVEPTYVDPDDIHDIEVVETIKEGKTVYSDQ